MSLKNCLLFQLARGVYQRLPNGWSTTSKKKEVSSVLEEILGVPVRLVDEINIAELVSGISLSDTLFFGPIYIPSSTRNIPKSNDHNQISNFVSLGAEIAGLDISNCTLDSILVCGTPETTLKSQGLNLDASILSNAVFAFTNLHGLSCRGTQFNDVLMRNCSIELASFIDYRISRSLSICNDTPGMITPLRQSVFSCIEPQPEDHEFVLSRIVFDQCLILGYFEPTHLFGVTFQDCQFGDTGQYSQPSECIIKGGPSSKNDWEFHQSLFSKCNFENLHDSLYFRDCCEVKTIFFRDCQVKDMIFETPSNLDKMTITIEASSFENFVLTAEKQTASKKLPQIMIDRKDLIKPAKAQTSVINNPDLANIEIIGALDRLTISVDKDRTGSLRNCVITCKILTKSFLRVKGKLLLKEVCFQGTPDNPIILKQVDFSNCIFHDTSFKNCMLKSCIFPRPPNDSMKHEPHIRAVFDDCILDFDKLEKADLSDCEFHYSDDFLQKAHPCLPLDLKKVTHTSFVRTKINTLLYAIDFKECDFSSTQFYQDIHDQTLALESCRFVKCTGLSLAGIHAHECTFISVNNPMQLIRKVRFSDCHFERSVLKLKAGSKVEFDSGSELNETKLEGLDLDELPQVTFNETYIRGCLLEGLLLQVNAFDFSVIEGVQSSGQYIENKIQRCTLNGAVFSRMKLGNLTIDNCSYTASMQILRTLITGPILLGNYKLSGKTEEVSSLHITFTDCYDEYSCINNNPFISRLPGASSKYEFHGTVRQSGSLDIPNTDFMEYDLEFFIPNNQIDTWRANNPLYNEYVRDALVRLWEGGSDVAILEPLGHSILNHFASPLPSPQLKEELTKEHIHRKIEKIVKKKDLLHRILGEDTCKEFLDYLNELSRLSGTDEGLETILEKEKYQHIRQLVIRIARATRLRLSTDVNKTNLAEWLNEITHVQAKIVGTIPSDPRDKVYGNFLQLEEWINNVYLENVQSRTGHAKVTIRIKKGYAIIRLGDEDIDPKAGFGSMKRKDIISFIESWDKLQTLRIYSMRWLKQNKNAYVNFTTTLKDGRVRLRLDHSVWHQKPLQDDDDWCKGTVYEIPLLLSEMRSSNA